MAIRLLCYRIHASAPEIVPGRPDRSWMDFTNERFSYRCIPLTLANTMGWEILCNRTFSATWTGGSEKQAITLVPLDGGGPLDSLAVSHFGHGVLTFHTGYLFKTDPGWGTICRGAPNFLKDGIMALDGMVETDWLPFGFTMNWLFTRPGTVTFAKGDPFCFIMPLQHLALDTITPEILPLASNPELSAENQAWADSRSEFVAKLALNDSETVREKWQKFYLHGTRVKDGEVSSTHRPKLRLSKPTILTLPQVPSDATVETDSIDS